MMFHHRWPTTGLMAAAALLAGCANLEPVATLGGGVSSLATSFRPLVDGVEKTCLTRMVEQDIRVAGEYDYKAKRESARLSCKPISDAKDTAFMLSTTVDGYGAALVSLAGFKPDALSSDIGSLADAASSLKSKSGDAFFNAGTLSAASKLASSIVEWVLRDRIKKVTRGMLVDAHAPLTVTVTAMKTFATQIAALQTDMSEEKLKVVLNRVITESNVVQSTDPATMQNGLNKAFAYRVYQVHLYGVMDSIAADRKRADDFGKACDALLAAHAELKDHFDDMTETDRLKSLKEFIKKARELRDNFNKL